MKWIHLAQDTDQCWDPVSTVMNLRGIKDMEFLNKLSDCQLLKRALFDGVS